MPRKGMRVFINFIFIFFKLQVAGGWTNLCSVFIPREKLPPSAIFQMISFLLYCILLLISVSKNSLVKFVDYILDHSVRETSQLHLCRHICAYIYKWKAIGIYKVWWQIIPSNRKEIYKQENHLLLRKTCTIQ